MFRKSILVLAPHTDDAELGCGGFIVKSINGGSSVTVVNFSDAWQSLPGGSPRNTLVQEATSAGLELGII